MNLRRHPSGQVLVLLMLLTAASGAHAATQTLEFQSGFNFLGLTVTPQAPLTTESLFETGAVQAVFLFDGQSQSFVYQLRTGQTLFGQSRAITPGAGVIVRADGAASRQVEGDAFSPAALQLSAGFNFIGAPALQGAVGVKALMGAYGDIESVFRWDFATQGFAFVLRTPSQLFGADFTLVPGAAYFMKATQGGQVALDPGQFPAKTLASIALSRTTDTMQAGATYNLATVTAQATYSDLSAAAVTPSWSVPGAQGAIDGTTFTPAQGATTATLTASYTEGGITRTATLTLAIQQTQQQAGNPALRDLTLPGFAKRALIAVNTNGAQDGAAESVGELPANVAANAPRFAPAIPVRSMIKDRPDAPAGVVPGAVPLRAPSRAATKLTHESTTHTFTLTEDNGTRDMPATKVYGTANGRCLIFVETAQLGAAQSVNWNSIGGLFDQANSGIYDKMVAAFGAPSDMDDNGKIIILYYAMAEANTMGYFYSVDLTADQGNRGMEIFYMNLTWGGQGAADPADLDMIRTLAHEFQHLINHAQRRVLNQRTDMDTWMNEGLAESAEQLVGGTVGQMRINAFMSDQNSKIRAGHPVAVWKGDDESYALVYTFFQYLKNQANDRDAIFKRFIEHEHGDHRAIEAIMKTQNPAFADVKMADLFVLYRVANLVNGDGIYGYGQEKNSFNFTAANALAAPANPSNRTVESGGAIHVYPSAGDLTTLGSGVKRGNIEFVRINP